MSHHVTLLASEQPIPVGKILCLGRNYLDHIRELGNAVPDRPVIFCKPASSLLKNGGQILLPDYTDDCHHELELALLVGKTAKNIAEQEALSHLAGYGVALDLTLRDLQAELKAKGLPWELAKGFDTSCPVSAFVAADQISDPDNLNLRLHINGSLRQSGNTNMMMRPVAQIVAELSRYYTLEAGDLILTGTPGGVARIASGDRLRGEIEGVGVLEVSVA
ncbi:MAG: acylpyruvase [Desulfuromonas sp.]|nr:MAG: acylpyruvase [Desulfuromonas sp.]